MTNLAGIKTREDYKYVTAGLKIEGNEIYDIEIFEAQQKPLHDFLGIKKEDLGIKPNPSGHSGKFRQIANAEAQMELGLDVDYYNGAAIDGKTYMKAYMKENDFTEEELTAWMLASFLLDRKGLNIVKSGESRDRETFKFIDGHIQKFNKLRNKRENDLRYCEFIAYHKELIFDNLHKLLANPIFTAQDEYKDFIMEGEYVEHDVYGRRCIPKPLLKKLKKDALPLSFDNIKDENTVLIGNRFALTISQTWDGSYELYNVLNSEIVGNFPSLASIALLLQGMIIGLQKALWEDFSPEVLILPGNHDFALYI